MKIIVTSGATREHIDPVRFISNTSTGSLGRKIAENAAENGISVVYIHGQGAELPAENDLISRLAIVSVEDAKEALLANLIDPEVKAVVHPMAVSDFTPISTSEGKISSSQEELVIKLKQTPKIIKLIKDERPDVFLISFKLESGISEEELIEKAKKQISATGSDIVVANLTESSGPDNHEAIFVTAEGIGKTVEGKNNIAAHIISLIKENTS